MFEIGIVGAGGMGTVHISNYGHIDNARVAAICDRAPEAEAKAKELGVPLYKDLEEMLQGEELDVIDICTPTFLHREHVTTSLMAGKHVICEKPLTLKYEDAKAMITLAEEKQVLLCVGQVLQYSKEAQVLHELVESGCYGKPLDAVFLRLAACPGWVKGGWLFDKEKSGLLPYDLHIHDLDFMISLFGKPETVSYTSCGNKNRAYKEHYRFSYGYDNLTVSAEAAWYSADIPFTANWRVYFEQAVVINDGTSVTAYQTGKEPKVFDTEETLKIPTGINLAPTGMFHRELSDFLGRMERGETGCSRREDILEVIRILEGIES